MGGSYDQRCDIWSLGVILYILVTAVPPFDGDNDKEIIEAVKKGNYDLEIEEMKPVSKDCKDLIFRMLQPEDKRITLEKIYQHPWIRAEVPSTPLKLNFKRLKEFVKFNKVQPLLSLASKDCCKLRRFEIL